MSTCRITLSCFTPSSDIETNCAIVTSLLGTLGPHLKAHIISPVDDEGLIFELSSGPSVHTGLRLVDIEFSGFETSTQDDGTVYWRSIVTYDVLVDGNSVGQISLKPASCYVLDDEGNIKVVIPCSSLPPTRYFESDSHDAGVDIELTSHTQEQINTSVLLMRATVTDEEEVEIGYGYNWQTD